MAGNGAYVDDAALMLRTHQHADVLDVRERAAHVNSDGGVKGLERQGFEATANRRAAGVVDEHVHSSVELGCRRDRSGRVGLERDVGLDEDSPGRLGNFRTELCAAPAEED